MDTLLSHETEEDLWMAVKWRTCW